MAPRFAPNGAESAPRGAARRRTRIRASSRTAYNASQTQTHAAPRDSLPAVGSRVCPVARGRATRRFAIWATEGSTPAKGAGRCGHVSWLDAAREFGLHHGLRITPPTHKLTRRHAIHCRGQGPQCAPWRGVEPNDSCERCSGTFFAGVENRPNGAGTHRARPRRRRAANSGSITDFE